VLVFVNDDG